MIKDRLIKVAINRTHKGKLPKSAPFVCGGRDFGSEKWSSNAMWKEYGKHFAPTSTTAYDFAVDIWRGYAFTPLFNGERRIKGNFVEAWHVALDFDTDDVYSSIDHLKTHDFIDYFSSFVYSTPSSTTDKPRSRVVFIFDEPITSMQDYEDLYKCLLARFGQADKSCKDLLRLFYGSEKCELWGNWQILTMDVIKWELELYRAEVVAKRAAKVANTITIKGSGDYKRYVEGAMNNICDKLSGAPSGEHNNAMCVAGFSAGTLVGAVWARLSFNDALQSLVSACTWPTKHDIKEIERVLTVSINKGMEQPRSEPVTTVNMEGIAL